MQVGGLNSAMRTKKDITEILDALEAAYPDAECMLHFSNNFELLIAVALSAQTTDKSVNKVTPLLFSQYSTPELLMSAHLTDVEKILRPIGMHLTKSKNIVALAGELFFNYDGIVPNNYEELIKLPGVGRKTANVVLSVGFGEPAIAVDTHVFRVSNRIGLAKEKNVLSMERALMRKIQKERWSKTHQILIAHGRGVCHAQTPRCDECGIFALCEKNGIINERRLY